MTIEHHHINETKIAEVISSKTILRDTEDGLNLMGDLYYQGFDGVILHEKNITPDFFDLKTKIAGEILQKFAQYRMPLVIVGDLSKFSSKSLTDFIYESNKGRHVNFVASSAEALKLLSTLQK